jgi:hypothetical protein
LLIFGGLAWIAVKDGASELAAPLFGITANEMKETFFRVLMGYRAAIIFLNLVPYIVLKIMGSPTIKTGSDKSA